MSSLLKEYRDLEMKTLNQLRDKVNESTYESNYVCDKAIPLDVSDFDDKRELLVIDGSLTFIDSDGQHQSIFNESLEDLIRLLESL